VAGESRGADQMRALKLNWTLDPNVFWPGLGNGIRLVVIERREYAGDTRKPIPQLAFATRCLKLQHRRKRRYSSFF
jgi:hypothetical protein